MSICPPVPLEDALPERDEQADRIVGPRRPRPARGMRVRRLIGAAGVREVPAGEYVWLPIVLLMVLLLGVCGEWWWGVGV